MYLSGQKIATDDERATSLWHSSVIQQMKASTFISESSSPAVSSFLDAAAAPGEQRPRGLPFQCDVMEDVTAETYTGYNQGRAIDFSIFSLKACTASLSPGVSALALVMSGTYSPLLCGAILNAVGFPGGASGKESVCQFRRCKRHRFEPWVERFPWRSRWQSTPVFLPGKSHGQRSLVVAKGRTSLSRHTTTFWALQYVQPYLWPLPPDTSGKPCCSRQRFQTLPTVPGVGWVAGRGRKPSGLRTVDSTYLDKISLRGYPGST